MTRYKKGDRVKCRGEIYYVVAGPTVAALGDLYDLSKVPAPIRVLENEMELAPEEEREPAP